MLRLRMPAGRVTAKKLAYIAESIRKYQVPRAHFTTCQTIQLHDMDAVSTCDIMEGALDVGTNMWAQRRDAQYHVCSAERRAEGRIF